MTAHELQDLDVHCNSSMVCQSIQTIAGKLSSPKLIVESLDCPSPQLN